jgi:formylglycine-generating enzyme required for sulfatase activity
MSGDRTQPREYDAIKGGQNLIPLNAAVLGGIPGVKSRLASPDVEVRIATLCEALKYGEAGLDLIIQALHDKSMQVKFAAYALLKDRDNLKIKLNFPQDYLPTFEFDIITVDAEGKQNIGNKSFACYFPEDLGNRTILEMVYIPSGTFMMGLSQTEEAQQRYKSPLHQVTVPAFFAGKYPITQAQWQSVIGNNPSHFKGEKRPVEQVNWYEAVEFCQILSENTGKNYRLLSEAEWEYACRAGTSTSFYFGNTIPEESVNYSYVTREWIEPPYFQTTDVGIFPPNAFGLYDMHGNVTEWCSDRWHYDYQGAPHDGSSWEHDESSWETDFSESRVQRGGSWSSEAEYCRADSRDAYPADESDNSIGFRVAAVLQLPAALPSPSIRP